MPRYTLICVALFSLFSTTILADWEPVTVPGEQDFTGYAYYRTWFKPHDSFFSKHERDLFGESVILNVRGLAGAHAVFVNGTQIGIGGQFPPDYHDGRDGNHRHKIPSGTLVKGHWNELVFKVYNPSGKGGFLTEAPFVMNYFWECVFAGKWELRKGGDESFLGSAVKEKPNRTQFDLFRESNRVLGEAEQLVHGEKLTPSESLSKMKAADDLIVELMLAEPLVAQPTHFSFDSRGRLWVSQYRQYPYPAGVQMISRDRYYRSHYDRIPPAPPNHDRGRDVISIHEDTDGMVCTIVTKFFRTALTWPTQPFAVEVVCG